MRNFSAEIKMNSQGKSLCYLIKDLDIFSARIQTIERLEREGRSEKSLIVIKEI